MLLVKLYDSPRHGMVHVDCWHTRRRVEAELPDGYQWGESASVQAADLEFPDHPLFWCSLRDCFGPDNPRRYQWR